jgi:hypothetical protein
LPGQVVATGNFLPGNQTFGKWMINSQICLDVGCGSADNTAF